MADAEATEGEDASLDFVVTLDATAGGTVTVDYATAESTTTVGDDYTDTSGALTFTAGDTTNTAVAAPRGLSGARHRGAKQSDAP